MAKAIKKFNKSSLKSFSADMQKVMNELAEKHGLDVQYKGGRYTHDGGEFTPKFEFAVKAENSSDGLTESARQYIKNCQFKGMKPEWLNIPFTDSRGDKIEIIGWNSSRPKNCIALKVNDDKKAMSSPGFVLQFANKLDKAAAKRAS